MSLCIIHSNGNGLLVCGDSRVSTCDQNNNHFVVHDNYRKVRQFGNKVIFFLGSLGIAGLDFFNMVNDEDTIEQIVNKAKKVYNDHTVSIKYHEKEARKANPNYQGDYAINIFTIEDEKIIIYQLIHNDDWQLYRQDLTGQNGFMAVGAHRDKAYPYASKIYKNEPHKSIKQIILETYEYLADERVGGFMHCFIVVPGYIGQDKTEKIRDNKVLKRYDSIDFHADSNGNVRLSGFIETGSIITNSSITGGTINIGTKVNNEYPFSVSSAGALVANSATVRGSIDCSSLKINGSNALTANNKINDDFVAIRASTISALNIQAGSVRSDWVYANNINANQITAGILSGITLEMKNTNGQRHGLYSRGYFTPESNVADIALYGYGNETLAIWNGIGGADILIPSGQNLIIGSRDSEYYSGGIKIEGTIDFSNAEVETVSDFV